MADGVRNHAVCHLFLEETAPTSTVSGQICVYLQANKKTMNNEQ